MLFCEGLGKCRGYWLEPEQRKRKRKGKENITVTKTWEVSATDNKFKLEKTEQKQTKKFVGDSFRLNMQIKSSNKISPIPKPLKLCLKKKRIC